MKRTPPPVILFPPAGADHNVHELLQWLQTLLRTIDEYYADQWPRPELHPSQLPFWDDDEVPF